MAKSEKFNASVNFGAKIDPSLGKAIDRLTGGILDVETTTEKAMKVQAKWVKDMESGGSSAAAKISTVTKAMTALEHKQAALNKKMHEAQKEGKDISDMAMDYGRMTHGIEQARKELEALNKEQEKSARSAKRWESMLGPTKDLVGKVRGAPGHMLDSAAAGIGNLPFSIAKGIGHTTKWAALGSLGLAGGAIGSGLALMDNMAEDAGIAKSYGLSYEKYKTGGIVSSRAGLNAENFGDLTEELSNKLGEQGNEKSLNGLLGQLGMVKSQFKGVSKEKQFDTIMQALSAKAKNGGQAEKVQMESLADQLMGGEANKLLSYIIGMNETYEEAMNDAKRMQNTTNEEAAAAVQVQQTLSDIWVSGESALEGMIGEIGKTLEPYLKGWEDSALDWIKENKGKISAAIDQWNKDGGPERLLDNGKKFIAGIGLLADEIMEAGRRLKWILPDADGVKAQKVQDYLGQQIARGTNPEAAMAGAKSMAEDYGIEDWFAAQHYENADNLQLLASGYLDGNANDLTTMGSVGYGDFDDNTLGGPIPAMAGTLSQDTYHINPTFNITMQPDQSPQDVSQTIMDEFNKMVPNFSPAPTFDTN